MSAGPLENAGCVGAHAPHGTLTSYERNNRHNRIVYWLHARRYRRLAELLRAHFGFSEVIRVVEIGCGTCRVFAELAPNFRLDYLGIDIERGPVDEAHRRYGARWGFQALVGDAAELLTSMSQADVVVAFETLEHLPASTLQRVVEHVARMRPKLFVSTTPVEVGPMVWVKNIGSAAMRYNRHREYSWRETLWAGLGRLDKLPPHTIWHKGYDWRALVQLVARHMHIAAVEALPVRGVPVWAGTNAMVVAEPYG